MNPSPTVKLGQQDDIARAPRRVRRNQSGVGSRARRAPVDRPNSGFSSHAKVSARAASGTTVGRKGDRAWSARAPERSGAAAAPGRWPPRGAAGSRTPRRSPTPASASPGTGRTRRPRGCGCPPSAVGSARRTRRGEPERHQGREHDRAPWPRSRTAPAAASSRRAGSRRRTPDGARPRRVATRSGRSASRGGRTARACSPSRSAPDHVWPARSTASRLARPRPRPTIASSGEADDVVARPGTSGSCPGQQVHRRAAEEAGHEAWSAGRA